MQTTLVAIHPCPSPQAVPLANAFLLSYQSLRPADDAPVEIILRDFFIGQEPAVCAAELLDPRPAAVGLSMYTWNRTMCLEIARELRRLMPGISLFAGGPEATADPGGILKDSPFDFLVVGEGEEPFSAASARLAAGENLSGIPGIALAGEDGLLLEPARPLADLDVIPSPWLNGVLDAGQYRGILWQLSRGCAFSCDFCYDSRGSNGVRRFSLTRIEAELRHFAAAGVSQIFVLDSTFNQDARRAKTILRLIKKIAPRIHFHFEVRSEFIDAELAQLFAETTCSLQIGLQSASAQILHNVGRRFNCKDFGARIALLNGSGAVFGFDLMYGLPGDTLDGFCTSLDFALGLYPNHLDIFPLAILPGTALATRSDNLGLRHLPAPPYTLLCSPSFSAEEMARARTLANACDIFYTRGKAVAWFNSVISVLRIKPSAFLQRFGEWLADECGPTVSEAELDDRKIWLLQRNFMKKMFEHGKLRRFLPLALDLADYHHHYAAALLTPAAVPRRKAEAAQLLERPARLAPATRLAQFHYEIIDILEAGEVDIRSFCNHFPPSVSWAAIYHNTDGICTESIGEPYYRLLQQLDGRTPSGRIASRLGIAADEALQFMKFAAAEGIIVPLRHSPAKGRSAPRPSPAGK